MVKTACLISANCSVTLFCKDSFTELQNPNQSLSNHRHFYSNHWRVGEKRQDFIQRVENTHRLKSRLSWALNKENLWSQTAVPNKPALWVSLKKSCMSQSFVCEGLSWGILGSHDNPSLSLVTFKEVEIGMDSGMQLGKWGALWPREVFRGHCKTEWDSSASLFEVEWVVFADLVPQWVFVLPCCTFGLLSPKTFGIIIIN